MAQTSEEGRRMWENGITQAYLNRLNQYAFENGLITEDIYRKMQISIKINYDKTLDQLKQT